MENEKWFIEFVLIVFIISGTFIIGYRYLSHHINNYQKYVTLCEKDTKKYENVYDKKTFKGIIKAGVKAKNCTNAIKIQSNESLYYSRGLTLEYLGLHKKAKKDFKKSLNWKPDSYKAQFFLGFVTEKQGDEETALEEYSKTVELNPKFAQAHYRKGLMKQHLKDYEGAYEDYEKAIALDSKYGNALLNRGYVAEKFKSNKEIIQIYTDAITVNPTDYRLYYNRGKIKQKSGDFVGAIMDYEKSVSIKPTASAYSSLCMLRGMMHDKNGVLVDCENAIKYDPKDVNAYNNRGYAKQLNGDYKGAMKDYKKAVSIAPEYKKARENIEILSRIMKK